MPRLACWSCGRQIYTPSPVDSLFSELGSGIGQSGWGYLARRQGIGQAWVAAGAFLVLGIPLLLLARRADPESDRFGTPLPATPAVDA